MSTPQSLVPDAPERLRRALAGRYTVEHEIGRGAMGIVYLARDVRLERPVAIKLLPPEIAAHEILRERFLREARTAARLAHPNIVPIHGIEEHEDLICFVMGFVAGETLRERVERVGPLDPDDVVEITRAVAWALGYAHANGVIHRDIKPENILLERFTGRPLVADFGVAKMADDQTLTQAADLLGTPRYMSPEQAGGEPASARSDLYALGVTAFYCLTARWPFEADSVQGLLLKHMTEDPPPVASLRPDVPAVLSSAVHRCLEKDPSARYPSADALGEALGTIASTQIPYPLLRLADEIRDVSADVVSYGTFGILFLPTLLEAIQAMRRVIEPRPGFLDLRGLDLLMSAGLVMLPMIAAGYRAMPLIHDIRRLRDAGFSVEDVQAATRRAALVPGASWRRVTAALVLAGGTIYVLMGDIPGGEVGPYVILGLGFAAIFWAGRQVGRALAPRVLAAWSGRLGNRVLRFLGWRTDETARLPQHDPTERILGAAAGNAFSELPEAQREMLGDVPELISRLETAAVSLREREAKLSRVLGEVGERSTNPSEAQGTADSIEARRSRAVAELRTARDAARERLKQTVAALELLRLDLLRLGAGVITFEDISFDLSRARGVSDEVDLGLGAHKEIISMLSEMEENAAVVRRGSAP